MRGRNGRSRMTPPAKKVMQPIDWHADIYGPQRYINHIMMELGRLGLTLYDIDQPRGDSPLSDLISWLDDGGDTSKLYEWYHYNLRYLLDRMQTHVAGTANPRIEITAHITARDNLSVRWYPLGWGKDFDWDMNSGGFNSGRVVSKRAHMDQMRAAMERMEAPPVPAGEPKLVVLDAKRPRDETPGDQSDFYWFSGDESGFERPSNELMFIHGVSGLRLDVDYGPYGSGGVDRKVLNAIIICAIRAAYDKLIERLRHNFQVTVKTVFVFEETVIKKASTDLSDRSWDNAFDVKAVTNWSLEDPEVLQQNADRAAYAAIEQNHGFTVEQFDEQLRIALEFKTGEKPLTYKVNEKLARNLKKAGFNVTKGQVENLRELIKRVKSRDPKVSADGS